MSGTNFFLILETIEMLYSDNVFENTWNIPFKCLCEQNGQNEIRLCISVVSNVIKQDVTIM